MAATAILIQITIIMASFIGGVVIYYVMSTDPKEQKKKQIEDVLSLSINFVIYIWIGKIIVNIKKFLGDPLAILAYPSNSYAFYIATLFIIMNVLYRKYRHHEQIEFIMQAFLMIFLNATFLYELMHVILLNQPYNKIYLFFITGLTVVYLALYGKLTRSIQVYVFGILLLLGQCMLTLVTTITIFGYRLVPSYFISLLIIVVITLTTKRKV